MRKRLFSLVSLSMCCVSVLALVHLVANPTSASTDGRRGLLPIDSLVTRDPADGEAIFYATQHTIAECMQLRGFKYPVGEYSSAIPPVLIRKPFGIFIEEDAARVGYGAPYYLRNTRGDGPTEYAARLDSETRSKWTEALWGTNDGQGESRDVALPDGSMIQVRLGGTADGCFAESKEKLQGPQEERFEYLGLQRRLGELTREAYEMSTTSEPVLRSLKQWRECISNAGYSYLSPNEIEAPQRDPEQPDIVLPAERDLALADVHCKKTSTLMETWWDEEVAAETRLLAQYAGLVKRWEALRAHELGVARGLAHSADNR